MGTVRSWIKIYCVRVSCSRVKVRERVIPIFLITFNQKLTTDKEPHSFVVKSSLLLNIYYILRKNNKNIVEAVEERASNTSRAARHCFFMFFYFI